MPPLRSLIWIGLLAGVLLAPSAFAQAPPASRADTGDVAFRVTLPDSVVVTASRIEERSQTTGRRVSVYSRQDIDALSVTTVEQLLDVVAGLDVQSRAGFGVQSDLTLRGSTFNGVLLLLDGARINDPMTGHFLMDLPVPLSEIARVEVLHGPATALYGPDAIGGVVHLITKTGLRSGVLANTGWAAMVDGRYGADNLYDAGGSARSVGAATAVSAAVTAQGSDGRVVRGDDGTPIPSGRGGPVRTDFQRRAATAAVARSVGGATLYARAGADDREFSAWHFYTPFDSDKAREATTTLWSQVRLQSNRSTDGSGTSWQVQLAGKQHRDRYTYNAEVPTNLHTSRMLTLQAQASRRVHPAVTLTGGTSGQLRGIDSNRYGLHSDASVGTFLSVRWQATPRLTLNQSTRVDYDPLYGVEPTPQLYLAYNVRGVTLRVGGGRAVRAPNYVERYIDSGGNRGTPSLDAEKAWSGEVGIDVPLASGVDLHLTYFDRVTQDLIDYATERPSAEVFVARNLHRVRTRGVESEVTVRRTLGPVGLRAGAAYTALTADLDTPERIEAYKYALTNPRHLVQGRAAVDVGAWTVSLQGLWKDRLTDTGVATASYGLMHGRLAYQLNAFDARVTVSAEVRNLFDTDYTEVFDAPMPGRTLLVGGRVQF